MTLPFSQVESHAKHLLKEVGLIFKHHQELASTTGAFFNIFSILGVESDEVRTHSAFLAELLNPKGSHGRGDAFLRLFTKQFGISELETQNASVRVEFHIGHKTETSGGRIDIVIQDQHERRILIENKVYAGDQPNQLLRYRNHDKNAQLFYLTLHGSDPTQASIGGFSNEQLPENCFTCISYREDILQWLDACRKEAVDAPVVRETLTQYISLIRMLTNQATSDSVNEQIAEAALRDAESVTAFFQLQRARGAIISRILGKLKADVEAIGAAHHLDTSFDIALGRVYTGFSFSNSVMEQRNIRICFQFQAKGTQNLFFGFQWKNPADKRDMSKAKAVFQDTYGEAKESQQWPCYVNWHQRRNWNDEDFKDIFIGKLRVEIEERVNLMLGILDRIAKGEALTQPTE